jgi:hypothetical protein
MISTGTIGTNYFKELTYASFPLCSEINSYNFANAVNLVNITLSSEYNNINPGTFYKCFKLTNINFLNISSIGNSAF